MRIVCLSDTHSRHKEMPPVPDGDVLVHSGDFSGGGSINDLTSFNAWLGTLPHRYKVVTPGNHDKICAKDPNHAKVLFTNATLLIDEETAIEGVRFYLSPWTPRFGRWSFMAERGFEMAAKWARIPEGIDVLVTHGPPYGILDGVPRFVPGVGITNDHVGCADLRKRVFEVKPRIHFFGHIHEGYGQETVNGVRFVNAATCNDMYYPENAPIVVDLNV